MNHEPTNRLTIYCDGGARGNPGPAASAFIIKDANNKIIHQQGFYLGVTTNNQAEYRAVLEALNYLSASHLAPSAIDFFLDSQLVVNQLSGTYKIKDPRLKILSDQIKSLILNCQFSIVNYTHIPRSQNFAADALVNQTLDRNH